MATEVKLPQLGQTMEEGTIVNCLVKVGDKINKGTVIFEVETDKATLEMESPAEGYVKAILAENGQTLPVGDPVMILADEKTQIPQDYIDSLKGGATPPAVVTEKPAATPAKTAAAPQAAAQPAAPAGRGFASPRAKKLAAEKGVDLAAVKGTGPNGRIVEKDVASATAGGAKPAAKPAKALPESQYKLGDIVPINRLQRITGQKMVQSKREIPCFYLNVRADVTDLVEFITHLNKSGGVKVACNDFLIKALAMGMEHFPIMAGQLDGDNIKVADSIGIGLAIAVPDGLVIPIVKGIEKKNLRQVAIASQEIIAKTKAGKLAPDDLSGGVTTLSNLGSFGIESFIPIVVPGQCSILGVGMISEECIPERGNIMVKKMMSLTLSVDHRIANGAYAAQYLESVKEFLQDPTSFA
ncbi:MAG: dihydrolipoamide acetyltransferase family protein [Phycisphaerae bacterium]|nr:dihydrolipoamide acetyltransferase family protein [Phycisphaerae bacterium]